MPKGKISSKHTKEVLSYLSTMIQVGRKERGWSETDLAARAGISRGTLQKIEAGNPGCAIGTVLEVAFLVGIPLFESDKVSLASQLNQANQMLALLPKRVRATDRIVSDDF